MALSFRRAVWLSLAAGLLLALPSLSLGLLLDDDFHRALVSGVAYPHRPLDLYAFVPGDAAALRPFIERGPFPWFTPPELKLVFFRPLSSALIYLDVWLFGGRAWPAHLHSIAWGLALIGAAALLYRRLLPERAAPFALLLFALDPSHATPVDWLANRNALVAAVPVVLGLFAHLAWRTRGWAPGAWLSAAGYAVGLCGAEAALAGLVYVPAYEAFGASESRRERLFALAPLAGVVAVWAVVYRGLGYGSSGSGIYLDPTHDPAGFLLAAGPRACALVGAMTVGLPSDFWLDPRARPVLVAVGLAGVALVAWLLRARVKTLDPGLRRTVAWLTAGSLLGLLPSLAIFPSDRLLLLPSLGGAAVVAVLLQSLWADRTRWSARLPLAVLGAAHLLFPLSGWLLGPGTLSKMARSVERAGLEPGLTPPQASRRLIAVAAPDFAQTLYLPLVRMREKLPLPESWNVLSFAPRDHRLTRLSDRSFEVEVVDGALFESVYEQMVRGGQNRLDPGDRVRLWHAWVTVIDSDGYHVRRLRLDLDEGAEAWQFVQWKDGRVVPLDPPEVGSSVRLARQKGAFDL